MPSDKSLVMNGSFENFSKEEVFDVVGLTRQCVEVVFDGESVSDTGKILVKAGCVLEATRPPDQGGKSAFVSLYTDSAAGFRVYTRPLPDEVKPLGTLADLIREARRVAQHAGQAVMGGLLDDFSVEEVLDVISLSRSMMEVQFVRSDDLVGTLRCKAGLVLSASIGERSGLDAFIDIFCHPGRSFLVVRVPETDELTEPLGTLREFVSQGRKRKSSESQSKQPPEASVMEGPLSETSLDEVLQVISLSRQLLEVVLSDESGTVGAIVVKAGHLLDAQAVRVQYDGAQALLWLHRNPGTYFTVLHRPRGSRDYTSLGPIAELLRQAASETTRRLPKVADSSTGTQPVVMEGSLEDFALAEVFEVLSLSRQRLRLILLSEENKLGQVTLKAGRVMSARVSGAKGIEAFRSLVQLPAQRFVVRRLPDSEADQPLGMLGDWLKRVQSSSASEVLIAGDFKQFSLTEVFDVLSLSRQVLVLEFRSSGSKLGSLRVKAGHVLACEFGDLKGQASFQSLVLAPGEQFVVRRESGGAQEASLGLLRDWLSDSKKPERSQREIVMAGSLEEFPLVEVMEVVSLSRQLMEISLRGKGKTRGAILVKSGMVLVARTRRSGKDSEAALQVLLKSPGDEFVVLLANWSKALPEPIMSVRALVGRLRSSTGPSAFGVGGLNAARDLADIDIDIDEDDDATLIGAIGPGDVATVVLSDKEVAGLIPDETVLLDDMTQLRGLIESLRHQVDSMPAPSDATLDAALASIRHLEANRAEGSKDLEDAVRRALAEYGAGRVWMGILVLMQSLTFVAVVLLLFLRWL